MAGLMLALRFSLIDASPIIVGFFSDWRKAETVSILFRGVETVLG